MRESSPRGMIVTIVLLLVVVVGAVVVLINAQPQPVPLTIIPPPPTNTPMPSPTPSPITVYVSGAVMSQPGLYALPARSRVNDALIAAGGAAPNADLGRLNLAATMRDGDQIYVPEIGETPPPLATPSIVLVYINSATLEELDQLPGVGPTLAQAIIAHRETVGAFRSLDDVDGVEGIGEQTLADIAEYLVFD